jgi:Tol biopolymer transport system component
LERILADPLFRGSNQISAFLRFIVDQATTGNSEQLKEYVIGVEVLKRAADYDPRKDPTVRILAGRLRSRLAEYYQKSGQSDEITITVPRGSYVPSFEWRSNQSGSPQTSEPPRRHFHGGWIIALASLIVFAALTATAWLSARKTGPYSGQAPVPLTSYAGLETQPSFSPDGRRVAFSWNGEKQDNYDIYIKDLGNEKLFRLTADPAREFGPAWSPDGRTIAFGRLLNPQTSGLFLTQATGGMERKLAESKAPNIFRGGPFVSWSPDGKWLAFSDVDNGSGAELAPTGSLPVSLFLISVETGERRRLTSHPPHSVGDSGPAFAPDGHALAFVRTQTLGISNVYRLPLSRNLTPAGDPRQITSWKANTNSPSWSPDGKEIVFSSGAWGRLQLWRVSESGKDQPRHLNYQAGTAEDPTISRRGDLAYAQKSTDTNIWRTWLSNDGTKGSPPVKFVFSTMLDLNPQFSPDGERIVFVSDRSGTRELWLCNADGLNPVQLTFMRAPITGGPRWSPDGSRIAFDSNPDGQFDVYVISTSGGPPTRMTESPADDSYGVWSPDGQWIYFMSSRTGVRQVWKMRNDGGSATQVTKNGGVLPMPSADGQFLYYSERAGEGERNGLGGLRRLRLADGFDELILPSVTFWNFTLTSDGIYFIPRADPDGHYSIKFFSFKTGTTFPIARLGGPVGVAIAVSPDRRSLLFSQIDEQRSDLMIVREFR